MHKLYRHKAMLYRHPFLISAKACNYLLKSARFNSALRSALCELVLYLLHSLSANLIVNLNNHIALNHVTVHNIKKYSVLPGTKNFTCIISKKKIFTSIVKNVNLSIILCPNIRTFLFNLSNPL